MPPDNPPTLDYTRSEQRPPRPLWPSIKLCLVIVSDAAILTALFSATPRLESWMGAQRMQIPALTRFWIAVAHPFNSFGWILFWMMIAAVVVWIINKRPAVLSDPSAWAERAMIRLVVLILFALPVILGIFAAVLPYFSLIDQLSSPRTG